MTFYWIFIFLLQSSCISATVSLPNKSEILSGTTYAEGIAGSYSNAPRGLINILQPNNFPYGEVECNYVFNNKFLYRLYIFCFISYGCKQHW